MTRRQLPGKDVSPLELFFDLVFVFAVSQLSHHLLEHLGWRGAAQTLVLLVAVFGVWSVTSWGSALPGVSARAHRWTLLAVMIAGLFMNAGISDAFADHPWLFVAPYLLARLGPPITWAVTGDALREHYSAMVVWFGGAGVLWVVGAALSPQARLLWWGAAAAVEVAGTWLAHPLPGRHFHTGEVAYAPDHMLERSRLFLIIALGEAVLSAGAAVSEATPSLPIFVTAGLGMIAVIALWALYFSRSDKLIDERAATTSDPLRAARLAVNTQILVLASLILFSVAIELAVDEPTGETSPTLAMLMFGGPILYLAVQAWYLRAITGIPSIPRLAAIAILIAAGGLSTFLPVIGSMAVLSGVLLVVVWACAPHRQTVTS